MSECLHHWSLVVGGICTYPDGDTLVAGRWSSDQVKNRISTNKAVDANDRVWGSLFRAATHQIDVHRAYAFL
eukprot:201642-Amphidinium_carterae.2